MIEWSDTDYAIRDAVREFIDKNVRPQLDDIESGRIPPYDLVRTFFKEFAVDTMAAEALEKYLGGLRRKEAETPEEREARRAAKAAKAGSSGKAGKAGEGGNPLGGLDIGPMASMAAIAVSEMAGVSLGTVASMGVSLGLGAATIATKGTLAQQERWLPKLVTGEHIAAWAITEPDAGSDAFGGMRTTVVRDGDEYVLRGNKTFITNGPYADVVVVYAKLDEGDGTPLRDRKVLTFVLDKGMPGLTQAPPFKKMGMMSSPTGELFFDDVRLGRDRLLGETEGSGTGGASDEGRESARANFVAERLGVAVLALGIINECHRLCVDYARNRTLWGNPIGDFQLIQLKLAKMEVARINVQNMVFSGIEHLVKGRIPSLGEASAVKWYSSEAATEVAMDAVQLFGGNGYMAEYRVEQLARDAKSLMIYAGSNEIQITHVAKGLLRG